MRHGGWSWSAHRAVLAAWVLLSFLGVLSAAHAGRNANGALIVHTNDAVNYTSSGEYCGIGYDAPDSCGAAGTRTDKDENTPAVIWLLAAFPDSSSPAVTAIQFGIDHNLPSGQGYFENYEMCGSVELPDAGWPETGFGNLVSFGSTVKTDRLFPFYVFAAYGFEDAYFGTTVYPSTEEAKFVDDSEPPVEDLITRFGTVRWYATGSNDCPGVGGGEEDLPDDPGGEDVPDDPEHEDVSGDWLDGDGQVQWVADCVLARVGDHLPVPPRGPVDSLGIEAFDTLSRQLGAVGVQRVLRLSDEACAKFPSGSRIIRILLENGADERAAALAFAQLPDIVWAQPDYVRAGNPFAEQISKQWHLNESGESESCIGDPEADCCTECDLGMDVAWSLTKGSPNVVVAFLDQGADMQHPDLLDAWMVNWGEDDGDSKVELCTVAEGGDIGDLDNDGDADDDDNGYDDILAGWYMSPFLSSWIPAWSHPRSFHGTAVAGILGAVSNNNTGIASVAGGDYGEECQGIRLAQFSYTMMQLPLSGQIESFYAASAYGAKVYSTSADIWVGPLIEDALAELSSSTLFICAAGNLNGTPMGCEFARLHGVMAVGGYDCESGARWVIPDEHQTTESFEGSDYGPELSLMGPADDQTATEDYSRMVMASTKQRVGLQYDYACSPVPGDATDCFGGTSAAAPVVASVAALVHSYAEEHEIDLSPDQVRKLLERTAEDIQCDAGFEGCECTDPDPNCASLLLGWDQYSGYGRVDAGRALTLPVAALAPLEPYADFVIWNGRVRFSWELIDIDPQNGGTPDHL